jgi:uncharacterized OB-fold protein
MTRNLGDEWTVPALGEYTSPYFASGKIQFQTCTECGTLQHPPDELCGACQGTRLEFREYGSEGRIETFAVVHQAVHPKLKDALPYTVVVVSVDDAPGVHAVGNIVNRPSGDVQIGQRVRAVFEEAEDAETGERWTIPQWEIVEA